MEIWRKYSWLLSSGNPVIHLSTKCRQFTW